MPVLSGEEGRRTGVRFDFFFGSRLWLVLSRLSLNRFFSKAETVSVLTEEQVAGYMDAASSEINFLLDKEDVDRLTQARLYEAGVLTVKQSAVLCKDVEEIRATPVKELGLEMETLKDKSKLSKLLVAFEIANSRSSRWQNWRERPR